MSLNNHFTSIEKLLAAALRGEEAPWPTDWDAEVKQGIVVEQALYHGVGGLLIDASDKLTDWPKDVVAALRQQAVAQTVWELRHKLVMSDLLTALGHAGIDAILLKGTALAYDLYENPAARARGDSDVLVKKADLECTRNLLSELGFCRITLGHGPFGDLHLQEVWRYDCDDGTEHHIDLHWQVMNAPALQALLSFGDCAANPIKLPRLCAGATSMARPTMLLHACIHRAEHITSPYYVDGTAYYGGDRLIWLYDMHLIAGVLSAPEWEEFIQAAARNGVSSLCLDGLTLARERIGTALPAQALERLAANAQESDATFYILHAGKFARSWRDLKALSGLQQKLAYLLARAVPSGEFMRARYPHMEGKPMAALYARRFVELLLRRPGRGEH